ncbi:MAG: GNAT family N-acetyltransferase [Micropruina sp.]
MIADSVRLALPGEAEQIAALQRRGWGQQLPQAVAGPMLAAIDLEGMTDSWRRAIQRPPLATFRVLVALDAERLTGFAVTGPSGDADASPEEDGLVAEFVIDPPAQRRGHGSRLLHAVVDTLRADGFRRATWWVRSSDDALLGFLSEAGWAADGAHTEVGTEDGALRVKLIRLHTDIAAAPR